MWRLEPVRLLPSTPNVTRNTTFLNFYSYGTRDWTTYNFEKEPTPEFFAYECSLYYCVKGYSANLSVGTTTHQLEPIVADKSHVVVDNESLLAGNEGSFSVFDDIPTELNAGPDSIFKVGVGTQNLLGWQLSLLFNGTTGSDFYASNSQPVSTYPALANTASVLCQASGSSLANLARVVQAISESLTTFVRNSNNTQLPASQEELLQFAPTVGVSTPIMIVRWGWLTYPLSLLIGSLAFLSLTIWATDRRVVQPWKGHRLPMLLASVDESVQALSQGGLDTRTGIDDRVGALRVRLDFDSQSIVFRRVYDSASEPLKGSGSQDDTSSR